MIPFLDIVTEAYRLAGALKAAGRGLSPEQQDEGLRVANSMFDGLKAERCFVYQVLRNVFDVDATFQDYAVGSQADEADWVVERPEHILGAGALIPSSSPNPAEIPIEVVRDYVQWKAITLKGTGSGLPRVLYYRPTLPAGTASLWPVPTIDSQVAVYTPGTVDEIEDIMAAILFPQGYREFVTYQLGCNVHDRYPEAKWSPRVEAKAREYKSRVMANQLTPSFMSCDPAALARPGSSIGRRWYDARTYYS